MRDGKLLPSIFVFFTGIFGVRKVQCYLSVQVTVLLGTTNECNPVCIHTKLILTTVASGGTSLSGHLPTVNLVTY